MGNNIACLILLLLCNPLLSISCMLILLILWRNKYVFSVMCQIARRFVKINKEDDRFLRERKSHPTKCIVYGGFRRLHIPMVQLNLSLVASVVISYLTIIILVLHAI